VKQLIELAKPFPRNLMGKDDRGNDAVDHTVVTQRLLQVVGPYDLEVREVLRSDVAEMTTRNNKVYPGGHFVTGVIVRLTLTIDGRTVSVEETGGCENAAMKDGDGERLKHAISDAIKRAAMREGLGLHMWAQDNFFLYDVLRRDFSQQVATDNKGAEEPTRGNDSSVPAARPGGGADAGTQPPTQADADPAPSPEPLRLGGAG
jgi:hypothetical protein